VAPAAWSYYGPAVLEEINSVGGEVAEDRLYEVLQRPRNAPRMMLTRNRPAEYTVPFDAALLTYTLASELRQVHLLRVAWDWPRPRLIRAPLLGHVPDLNAHYLPMPPQGSAYLVERGEIVIGIDGSLVSRMGRQAGEVGRAAAAFPVSHFYCL
jgi:hypothetical protein